MTLDGLQIKQGEKHIKKTQLTRRLTQYQYQKQKPAATITNQSATIILSQCLGKQPDF